MLSIYSNRGKRRLTDEQRLESEQRQRNRIKIANIVSRNDNINKDCCICGKPGRILHNPVNPYIISFICNDCAKDKQNLKMAIKYREDIRKYLVKRGISVKMLSSKDVQSIVNNYLNTSLTIGKYCTKLNITRYQFTKIVDRYIQLTGDTDIWNKVNDIKNSNRKRK